MVSEGRLLAAIRRLYDAATDAERWPAFLEEITRIFDAKGAHLFRVNPHERALTFSILCGFDEAVIARYGTDGAGLGTAFARIEQHYAQLMPTDPRVQYVERYPSRPFSCRFVMTEAEYRSSKVYQDILDFLDIEFTLGVSLPEDDGSRILMGIFRGKQGRAFDAREVDRLGELIPHMKRAIAISERLAHVDFANRAALEALDAISMGILIVDRDAHVMHANAAAGRIVRLGDGLALRNGVLGLYRKDDESRLHQAIWEAVASAGAGLPGTAVAAARPSEKEPFPLLVGALWGNHLRYGLGRLDKPLAVVLVTDPEQPQEAPAELLRRLFGLTPTEARICERLVRGATVEQSARDLNVATGTVRAHLKSVFAKAGVGRQAELVAKVMSSPVWIRNHRRGAPSLGPGGKEVVGS